MTPAGAAAVLALWAAPTVALADDPSEAPSASPLPSPSPSSLPSPSPSTPASSERRVRRSALPEFAPSVYPRFRFGVGQYMGGAGGGNASGLGGLGVFVNVGAQWNDLVGTYVALGASTFFFSIAARGALMVDLSPSRFWSIGLGASLDGFGLINTNDGTLYNSGLMVGAPLRFTFRPMRQESRGAHQGAVILADATPGVVLPHGGFAASFGFSWFLGIGWETH